MSVSVALLALFAACGGGDSPSSAPETGTTPGTVETAEPTARPGVNSSPHGQPQGVYLLQYFADGGTLTAIDPLTGEDIPGLEPIDANHAIWLGVTPDGSAAMGMRSPGQAPTGGLVHIDLKGWKVADVAPLAAAWFGGVWNAEGTKQYAIAGNSAEARVLFVADAEKKSVDHVSVVGVNTLGALLSPDGTHFYTIGFEVSMPASVVIEGDPFLIAIDVVTGEQRRLPLPGLTVGERLEEDPVRSYVQYTPGLALSPDGSRLYIAHAESHRISILDTASLQLLDERAVSRSRSTWNRFKGTVGGWFADTAHAKGAGLVERSLTFTPDGKFLLLTGKTHEWCDDRLCHENRPQGLKVLDPASLRVLREVPDISRVLISPDGRRIAGYAPHWFAEPIVEGSYTWQPTGVTVIDGDAVEGRAVLLHGDQAITDVVFTPDGQQVLSLAPGPGLADANNNRGHCAKPCYVLRVTSIAEQQTVATRFLDSFNPTLIGRGNDPW